MRMTCCLQSRLLLSVSFLLLTTTTTTTLGFAPPLPVAVKRWSSSNSASTAHSERTRRRWTTTWSIQAAIHNEEARRGVKRLWRRFKDPLERVVLPDNKEVLTSGASSSLATKIASTTWKAIKRIPKLHNPITYLVLALIAGFRYDWCFRNPYYWFGVAFCIKWYRARYVFRIPVWDRQPNWNNVITSREQEKELKALTCKNCGSTLFIAKTREFFFEGSTGIGGLGCFACGAKGADNFIMDRDRIVEDVGDMDDYFDYERPLDFVSRAERRKLLKETQGDEEAANQLILQRQQEGGETEDATTVLEVTTVQAEEVTAVPAVTDDETTAEATEPTAQEVTEAETEEEAEAIPEPTADADDEPTASADEAKPAASAPAPEPATQPPPPPAAATSGDDDDLDLLGMDL